MKRNLVRRAEDAVDARISRIREPLRARLVVIRERYCARDGGHAWTKWRPQNRELVGSWYPYHDVRWCTQCTKTESREST